MSAYMCSLTFKERSLPQEKSPDLHVTDQAGLNDAPLLQASRIYAEHAGVVLNLLVCHRQCCLWVVQLIVSMPAEQCCT